MAILRLNIERIIEPSGHTACITLLECFGQVLWSKQVNTVKKIPESDFNFFARRFRETARLEPGFKRVKLLVAESVGPPPLNGLAVQAEVDAGGCFGG